MSKDSWGNANLADTGRWKLYLEVSADGMCALLKNIEGEEKPIVLTKKEWEAKESEILANIENTVYDNPRILDDFATTIVITTDKALWIPTELTDDDEYDENLFTCVYPAERGDIFSDFGEDKVCLYTLAPGLNAFFQRTLPGCKITSHLSVLSRHFGDREAQKISARPEEPAKPTIYVNIRKNYADIFAYYKGEMLCGAAHQWREWSDIAYKIFLIADTYRLNHSETTIEILAKEHHFESLYDALSEFFSEVKINDDRESETDLPFHLLSITGI